MKSFRGEVVEVFLPCEENLSDPMYCQKIGFKVKVDQQIITIIQNQDEKNIHILKKDKVLITKKEGCAKNG